MHVWMVTLTHFALDRAWVAVAGISKLTRKCVVSEYPGREEVDLHDLAVYMLLDVQEHGSGGHTYKDKVTMASQSELPTLL